MDRMKISKKQKSSEPVRYDSLKLAYMEKFVNRCGDTRLVFVISPTWDGMDEAAYLPVEKICKDKNIPFVNFANNPKYIHNYRYFKDGAHLNSVGADEFTKDLMSILREKGV